PCQGRGVPQLGTPAFAGVPSGGWERGSAERSSARSLREHPPLSNFGRDRCAVQAFVSSPLQRRGEERRNRSHRNMTPPWRKRSIGLVLAAMVYAVDQWIKSLALGPWRLREVGVIDLLPFFDLRWTQNFGVSLGMFEATSTEMRWALVAVTGLIALVVFVWLLRERSMWDIAGLALILGGALGNIQDRYLYGYVIDYADFHIGTFRPFLVF